MSFSRKRGIKHNKNKLGVTLSEDEAGFIALHIVNALMDDISIQKATKMTKMIEK
ncbi:PRD domain-containing protein [Clostridium botulinum]|nr:PRD domain-containing protein [Clostridium botulinum]MCS4523111.1 PRD domain-containing protein [Clostridium botulinum]